MIVTEFDKFSALLRPVPGEMHCLKSGEIYTFPANPFPVYLFVRHPFRDGAYASPMEKFDTGEPIKTIPGETPVLTWDAREAVQLIRAIHLQTKLIQFGCEHFGTLKVPCDICDFGYTLDPDELPE